MRIQLDHPYIYNQQREREKALKALEMAKARNTKAIVLKKGECREFTPKKK